MDGTTHSKSSRRLSFVGGRRCPLRTPLLPKVDSASSGTVVAGLCYPDFSLLTVLDCVDCTYAHQSIEIYLMVRRKLVRIGPRSLSREAYVSINWLL